jgi:hypothetical protein
MTLTPWARTRLRLPPPSTQPIERKAIPFSRESVEFLGRDASSECSDGIHMLRMTQWPRASKPTTHEIGDDIGRINT